MTTITHARRAARTARALATTLLAGALLLSGAGPAAAEDEPEEGQREQQDGNEAEPTEAGTTFRNATALELGWRGTARASTGDYLYWVFPAGAGQDATARATVTFPDTGIRSGPATWQLDVYDGLRRRQPCVAGEPSAQAAQNAGSVTLTCTLRTVRPWAEPWSNDPLPGAYYLRLTAVELPEKDLGLPVLAEVETEVEEAGGARATGGDLPAPLVQTLRAGAEGDGTEREDEEREADAVDAQEAAALTEPDGGWSGGWWSDRWLWTAAGGILGALAGIGGYHLTRRPRG
ncbi:hypothetical protein GCM10009716_30060 [Streptomyces sodiiphilus]|uniref:Secreted protein n=1 Tax=Streptomyces sodiiphilus TaxID=226217 RepID=A0ABP5APV5_9ACTN